MQLPTPIKSDIPIPWGHSRLWDGPHSVCGVCFSLNKSTSYLSLCLSLNWVSWFSVKWQWVQFPIWVAQFQSNPNSENTHLGRKKKNEGTNIIPHQKSLRLLPDISSAFQEMSGWNVFETWNSQPEDTLKTPRSKMYKQHFGWHFFLSLKFIFALLERKPQVK